MSQEDINDFFLKTKEKLDYYNSSLQQLYGYYSQLKRMDIDIDYFLYNIFGPLMQDILSFDKYYIQLQNKSLLKRLSVSENKVFSLFHNYTVYSTKGNHSESHNIYMDLLESIDESIDLMTKNVAFFIQVYNSIVNSYNQYHMIQNKQSSESKNEGCNVWDNVLLGIGVAGLGLVAGGLFASLFGEEDTTDSQ